MKSLLKWSLALVLLAALVVSLVHTAPQAEADAVFYGDYTDVKKIYDASSCPSMQGLAEPRYNSRSYCC